MRNIPKISAIIPTYNSWGTLKECIRSLMQQSLKPTEIIIVDNASIDETGEEEPIPELGEPESEKGESESPRGKGRRRSK